MWPQSLPCSTASFIMGTCSSAARGVGERKPRPLRWEVLNESRWHDCPSNNTKSEEGVLYLGTLPPNPWDLPHSRHNGCSFSWSPPPPPPHPLAHYPLPAPPSALPP